VQTTLIYFCDTRHQRGNSRTLDSNQQKSQPPTAETKSSESCNTKNNTSSQTLRTAGSTFAAMQGRNEGERGAQFPGTGSLWGHRITAGDAETSQHRHKYYLQYRTFASVRLPVRTWGHQSCFLPRAPSNLVTPLLPYTHAKFPELSWQQSAF